MAEQQITGLASKIENGKLYVKDLASGKVVSKDVEYSAKTAALNKSDYDNDTMELVGLLRRK